MNLIATRLITSQMESCDLDYLTGEVSIPSFFVDRFNRRSEHNSHRTLPVSLVPEHTFLAPKDHKTVVTNLTQVVLQELHCFHEFVISFESPNSRRLYEIMRVLEWIGLVEQVKLTGREWKIEQSHGSQSVYRLMQGRQLPPIEIRSLTKDLS
jgi:hypothetical protein